jgi:hypothetical protein
MCLVATNIHIHVYSLTWAPFGKRSNTCRLEPHRILRVRVGVVEDVENVKSDAQNLSGLVLVSLGSQVSLSSMPEWSPGAHGQFLACWACINPLA